MKSELPDWPKTPQGRLRPIVAVVLDDGARIPVSLADLECYLRAERAHLLAIIGGALEAKTLAQMKAVADRATKRANARKPRAGKAVTKEKLEEHREAYIRKNRTDRGWPIAASIDFGISVDTITKRMSA